MALPNPIMPRTVAVDTLFCFGPVSAMNIGIFFDYLPPAGSRIGAVVLYRTAHRVFIQIDADATPGTIVGIFRAGRITIDGKVGVIGDGGAGDWKAWFTELFSRVDGIREVIGSSNPAPRGAIEAGIALGIQTGGFGLEGEPRDARAVWFMKTYPTVESRDAAIIDAVMYHDHIETAFEWLFRNRPPPDPMWARHRAVAEDRALASDDALALALARARAQPRALVPLPNILISVNFDDSAHEATMFFTGEWRATPVPVPWTTWTDDTMTIRADSHRYHFSFRRTHATDEVARPAPNVIAGIIAAVGDGGVVAVVGHGTDTDAWVEWFEELFSSIRPTEVISMGDRGPALGALMAAADLGVPTGGYVDGYNADGSGLEAEYGLTVGIDHPFFAEYALLTGETTVPPTYAAEALGPGWEDDVAAAPAPPGYDGRPPGYRPRLPPYQP
jgi:hypothetical protein